MTMGRTPYRVCGPLFLALLVGACGERTKPSAEESDQLNNAAEMLDEAPNTLSDIDEGALEPSNGNSAGPAPEEQPQ